MAPKSAAAGVEVSPPLRRGFREVIPFAPWESVEVGRGCAASAVAIEERLDNEGEVAIGYGDVSPVLPGAGKEVVFPGVGDFGEVFMGEGVVEVLQGFRG